MSHKKVLILGAGFTGLASAIELDKLGVQASIVERSHEVAGLSRTFELAGLKFELGPHIYFDKDKEVTQFWKSIAGDQMKTYYRNNRIFYDGKFIKSPLNLLDTVIKLGPIAVFRIVMSYLVDRTKKPSIDSAEDWVKSNFGTELFQRFFKVYNEKIWGIPCSQMAPDWAGQRIKSSLFKMVLKSLTKDKDFIIKTFEFPTGGSETLYKKQTDRILNSKHVTLRMGCEATRIQKTPSGFQVTFNNNEEPEEFTHIISTIHLDHLNSILEPNDFINEKRTRSALSQLKYRNLILVNLVFQKEAVQNFKEHWIDIHDPSISALRITNFGNHELGLGDGTRCGICVEYNCWESDELWKLKNEELVHLALSEMNRMKLTSGSSPIAHEIIRLPRAYPVYFKGYKNYINTIFEEFKKMDGLILAGRNSLYKWNNMHHSVKTGLLAARNIVGGNYDLFSVKGIVSIGKESD